MSQGFDTPETIFGRAIELESPTERAAFLDRACENDPQLRSEMEKLVADHFKAGGFLQHPAIQDGPTIGMPEITYHAGSLIGPYKLLEQIGEGGFGIVYTA